VNVSFSAEAVIADHDLRTESAAAISKGKGHTYSTKWCHEDVVASQECEEFLSGGDQLPGDEANPDNGAYDLSATDGHVSWEQARDIRAKWNRVPSHICADDTEAKAE
jgi:hypothetical protein